MRIEAIPKQGFEIIGERIASLLCKEFAIEVNKFKNNDARDVKFFRNRMVNYGHEEGDIINVMLWKGKFEGKGVDTADGYYQYVIDIVTSKQAKGDESGDFLANVRAERLLGMVRYILDHSENRMLGFEPPFIRHTEVTNFQCIRPEDQPQSDSAVMGQAQLVFLASCRETTKPGTGVPIAGTLTDVKVDQTNNGFQYQTDYE